MPTDREWPVAGRQPNPQPYQSSLDAARPVRERVPSALARPLLDFVEDAARDGGGRLVYFDGSNICAPFCLAVIVGDGRDELRKFVENRYQKVRPAEQPQHRHVLTADGSAFW